MKTKSTPLTYRKNSVVELNVNELLHVKGGSNEKQEGGTKITSSNGCSTFDGTTSGNHNSLNHNKP
ncbi:hypothetical protein [Pontimicrobium sp. MEBiC01747]